MAFFKLTAQKGFASFLLLAAGTGLLIFFLIAGLSPFKNNLFSALFPKPPSQAAVNLNTHSVVLDSGGKLLSWVSPQAKAYDEVMRLSWEFLLNGVSTSSNGYKMYYLYPYLYADSLGTPAWPNNPGSTFPNIVESAIAYYAYSGDARVITLAKQLMDHYLAHGMTPANYSWANVPYSSGDAGSPNFSGSSYGDFNNGQGDGSGVLEPDKIGEVGLGMLRLYEVTGDTRYRDSAINCANSLVSHVKIGTQGTSPWPFRVTAQNNTVKADYSGHAISAVRLFDELIRLNLGTVSAYQTTRQTALSWLLNFPVKNNIWGGYFEDVPNSAGESNQNNLSPMETAEYLLKNPQSDPNWQTDVTNILNFVESHFGTPDNGATAIKEQDIFPYIMGSHTSRFASVQALYFEKTANAAAKDKAFHSFNWATYMTRSDGRTIDGPSSNQLWWTDGYGDFIKHFLNGIASIPEWAPLDQNRMTSFTSVVKTITFSQTQISYTTFDNQGIETFRLTNIPSTITAGGLNLNQRPDLNQDGWTFDTAIRVLKVKHSSPNIVISGPFTATPSPLPSPSIAASASPQPSSGTPTITFDDLTPTNTALNGQYPTGVINWGTGNWYLSAPWQAFTTNSISFATSGLTTADFSFVTPKRLINFEAYSPNLTNLTVSCPGQISKQQSVSQQPLIISTGWTDVCSPVTITSSNGWNTNFDNFVYDSGPQSTPSPSVAASPSQIPSPSAKPGDIDGNNKVDIFDYNILLTNFGKTGSGIQGDLDGNNKVDIFDYNTLLSNFGH